MSLPYFPLYPTDFDGKTAHLTLLEDGAYNRLLRLCWKTPGCRIPAEEAWIMRHMRARSPEEQEAVRTILAEFFTLKGGFYSNKKLTEIWLASSEAHERRKNAGSQGGKAKALRTRQSTASNAVAKPKQPEPEPEPEENTNVFSPGDFEAFWAICPRKVGKGAARKAYAKAVKTADPATLFSAMQRHAEEVRGKDAQYIPHPSTWINEERWTDEPAQTNSGASLAKRAAEQWRARRMDSGQGGGAVVALPRAQFGGGNQGGGDR